MFGRTFHIANYRRLIVSCLKNCQFFFIGPLWLNPSPCSYFYQEVGIDDWWTKLIILNLNMSESRHMSFEGFLFRTNHESMTTCLSLFLQSWLNIELDCEQSIAMFYRISSGRVKFHITSIFSSIIRNSQRKEYLKYLRVKSPWQCRKIQITNVIQ